MHQADSLNLARVSLADSFGSRSNCGVVTLFGLTISQNVFCSVCILVVASYYFRQFDEFTLGSCPVQSSTVGP